MNRSSKTIAWRVAEYEPPCMSVMPLRSQGVLLAASGTPAPLKEIGSMDLSSGAFEYHGQYGGTGNTATEWDNDWSLTFGD